VREIKRKGEGGNPFYNCSILNCPVLGGIGEELARYGPWTILSMRLSNQIKHRPYPLEFFLYAFIDFLCILELCRPSEASTWYCPIPGGYPPQD
jgi:hypothetical protein